MHLNVKLKQCHTDFTTGKGIMVAPAQRHFMSLKENWRCHDLNTGCPSQQLSHSLHATKAAPISLFPLDFPGQSHVRAPFRGPQTLGEKNST